MVSEHYKLYLNKTMTRRIKCHCTVYCTACYVQCTVQSTVYCTEYSVLYRVQCTVQSTVYYTPYSSQCTVQCTLVHSTTMAKLFKCVCLYFLWGVIYFVFIKKNFNKQNCFYFYVKFLFLFSNKFKYLYTTRFEIRTLCHLREG